VATLIDTKLVSNH